MARPDADPGAMATTPPAPSQPADSRSAPCLRWLTVLAVTYGLTHHTGVTLNWLGAIGETRWADWIDVLTPYAVLLPAAAALHHGGAGRRHWVLFLAGAITYAEGHGIHLSANSVGNAAPSGIAHLWDEYAGHYVWYGGLTLVFTALAAALARRPAACGILPPVLALLTGLTFTTNALEGHTAAASIAVTAVFTAWGWATRDHLGRLMLFAFGPALLMLAGYGLWHGGFPEPTGPGWI